MDMKKRKKEKGSIISNNALEARGNAAWKASKASYRPRYADYYRAKYGEPIEHTIEIAKAGDDNALLQLIEWDKSYLSERFVAARIAIAESYCIEVNLPKNICQEGKRFLQRLSAVIKKVGQLPKIKKYWNLLRWLRANTQDQSVEQLASYARKQRSIFPAGSIEENLLADKRSLLVRFIKTHKHFIGAR